MKLGTGAIREIKSIIGDFFKSPEGQAMIAAMVKAGVAAALSAKKPVAADTAAPVAAKKKVAKKKS